MEQTEYAMEIIYLISVIKRQEEMGSGIIGGRINKHGFNTLVLKEMLGWPNHTEKKQGPNCKLNM